MPTEYPARNVLLTGGRAPVTLDLARKLHACGSNVYVAESLPQHICKYSRAVKESFLLPSPKFFPKQYIQNLCTLINDQEIDLLIPTCEEIFYIAYYRERITSACPSVYIFVDDIEKLKILHNKWMFIKDVQRRGKITPRTWLVRSEEEVAAVYANPELPVRLILKPVYSRFAAKLFEWRRNEAIPLLNASKENPWIIQEFIEGKQYCSYAICHDGRIMVHVVYAANFTAGKGACICFNHSKHSGIDQWVREFIKNLNFTGQIAFDFIETITGVLYPLECNPRATSGVHLLTARQLVDAFTIPVTIAEPQEGISKMLGLAMLFYGMWQCKSYSDFKNWLDILWQSQDIVFSLTDPAPFFYQLYVAKTFYSMCRRNKISVLEATTQDIEWNGEPL